MFFSLLRLDWRLPHSLDSQCDSALWLSSWLFRSLSHPLGFQVLLHQDFLGKFLLDAGDALSDWHVDITERLESGRVSMC